MMTIPSIHISKAYSRIMCSIIGQGFLSPSIRDRSKRGRSIIGKSMRERGVKNSMKRKNKRGEEYEGGV